MAKKNGVVAFSGGLDTSFLVPFSRERYSLDSVITCTVNTEVSLRQTRKR